MVIKEQIQYDINTFGPLHFCTLFYVPEYIYSSVSQLTVCGNMNKICIVVLCEITQERKKRWNQSKSNTQLWI